MAKDDYHVIVYKLLAYLYRCLKDGEAIQTDLLEPGSRMINVNQNITGGTSWKTCKSKDILSISR